MTSGFAVAISGGRDSTALLHASLAPAAQLGLTVHALHVHHNLQPSADEWHDHARRLCEGWAGEGAPVQFHAHKLSTRPPRGASIEAWAREQRYATLGDMARACGVGLVLLAHHRRDQAETFLLQALRGAGAAGLSAMPRQADRDGIVWARPWLNHPRAAIEAYVRQHGLPFVDDPSNSDPRFARSRLRREVWPVLAATFPDAEGCLAAAASQAQDARAALDELAAADLSRIADPQVLHVDRWLELSTPRRLLALRTWLRAGAGRSPGEALVRRLMVELQQPGPARWPLDPRRELQHYRARLAVHPVQAMQAPAAPVPLAIAEPGDHRVNEWGGTLRVTPVPLGGIAMVRLHRCELRARQGGERFRAGPGRPARSLKKHFQAQAIGPCAREVPLLYCDGRLAFVPGLGIHADELAGDGEPQATLEWLADAAPFAAPQ